MTLLPAALPSVMLPAHGIGSREDLPLPFDLLLIGAGLALAISFVALGVLWKQPRLRRTDGRLLPPALALALDSPFVRGVFAVLSLALTAWVLMSLVFGKDDANNPVPYVVYVWLWVGLGLLSMVLGPIWRVLNPVRYLHRGLLALARVSPDFSLAPYRLGYWPAALGLFAFTWLELIAPDNATLPVLRVAILGFLLISVMLAMVFGRDYFATGDPFEAWSGLYGSLSPLGRREDGRWVLRTPLHGPNELAPRSGLLATTSVMLGGTAYDGFSGETWWYSFTQSSDVPRVWETLALVALCLLVPAMLWVAAAVSAALAKVPVRGLATAFAPSLIPIAAGYLVAHYWSLFVFEGVNGLARLSDPLGTGANWLGTAGIHPWHALIDPGLVATIQVVSIVTGHLLGVVVAHERAVSLFPRRVAVTGQVPLLVLMVVYTVGGLTLLFSH
ncbi:hypothetical protein SAMN05216199_3678 [Pedococcus cremeus]|uniref:Fenitrothion hydrolase n=1 Tax=Pedococcus cremeus TaxID=587636 RepID=A0A1H9XD63_9MICO|nr:hypothetical protein [Pedococcus cremeus]SES43971.1 hypothetical protein SAMN05216199_3678 [Pedococcus cremeus]